MRGPFYLSTCLDGLGGNVFEPEAGTSALRLDGSYWPFFTVHGVGHERPKTASRCLTAPAFLLA